MIKLLFFAQLAELAGQDSIELEATVPQKVYELIDALAVSLSAEALEVIRDESTMVSINHAVCDRDDMVCSGDEVAFLPPFSGG